MKVTFIVSRDYECEIEGYLSGSGKFYYTRPGGAGVVSDKNGWRVAASYMRQRGVRIPKRVEEAILALLPERY